MLVAVLIVETVLLSMLIQATLTETTGIATTVHTVQHWLFRLLIAYAASWILLRTLRGGTDLTALDAALGAAPLRPGWFLVHLALLAPLAFFSATLYGSWLTLPFVPLAIGWHLCALGALLALCAAMAPLQVWRSMLRGSGALAAYAAVPALAAVLVIQGSQRLWIFAARITFELVATVLRPLVPGLLTDAGARIVDTGRFAVEISEICSGLEGVGLMFVFCCGWLWYFRGEFRFPRALLVIPVALVLVFLLNTMRIAAIVLIGDAGYERLAMIGFHSQAGWIAFNLVAFGVAIAARRSRWLTATPASQPLPSEANPVSPYLMPLLATLATGMLVMALSTGFDLLYPLRPVAAGLVLWHYRHRYRGLGWGWSWRGVTVGAAVFAVWLGIGHWLLPDAGMPADLAALPLAGRWGWVASRVLAAVVTVPIAEELAYRGFVMRRCAAAQFDAIPYSRVGWPGILISSLLFGAAHGGMWFAASIAGLGYGLVAKNTNRIGEAVVAHATSNALLAVAVLGFGQWQWW